MLGIKKKGMEQFQEDLVKKIEISKKTVSTENIMGMDRYNPR